jgi:hypothetical protein
MFNKLRINKGMSDDSRMTGQKMDGRLTVTVQFLLASADTYIYIVQYRTDKN